MSGKLDERFINASQTPQANTIPVLDANAVLDLSTTFVKSNVYTFRRVNLTDATSDYELQVGEEAYIEFTDATSVPLHIATSSGTFYELDLLPTNEGREDGGGGGEFFLNPNNTTYSSAFKYAEIYRNEGAMDSNYCTYSAFRIGYNWSHVKCNIWNTTQYKSVFGLHNTYGQDTDYPSLILMATNWRDTTTPWTSLGTITFSQSSSGVILVRRLR